MISCLIGIDVGSEASATSKDTWMSKCVQVKELSDEEGWTLN